MQPCLLRRRRRPRGWWRRSRGPSGDAALDRGEGDVPAHLEVALAAATRAASLEEHLDAEGLGDFGDLIEREVAGELDPRGDGGAADVEYVVGEEIGRGASAWCATATRPRRGSPCRSSRRPRRCCGRRGRTRWTSRWRSKSPRRTSSCGARQTPRRRASRRVQGRRRRPPRARPLRGPLPEPEAAGLAAQVADAFAGCHRRGVAHRDVKPDNLFFDASGALRLGDFGSAGWFGDGRPMSGLVGTPYYVAPEVVAGGEYTEKVDVWSAGVVIYVMLSGTVPFYGATAPEIFEAVLRGNLRFPPRAFAGVSPEAKDLMRRMLCKDVSRRFSAEQVLRHPWIVTRGGSAA